MSEVMKNKTKAEIINNIERDGENIAVSGRANERGFGIGYITVYDKTMLAMEIIGFFLVMLICFGVYILGYKVTFLDPIATVKNNFSVFQIISMIISIISTMIITICVKDRDDLIKKLIIVAILSVCAIITQIGIKTVLDNKYNETVFGEFYELYEKKEDEGKDLINVDWGIASIKITNEKDEYINKSIRAYTNFSVKTMSFIIIYIILVAVLGYIIYRIKCIDIKKDRLEQDDKILFKKVRKNNV